jgi:hypothetical protein
MLEPVCPPLICLSHIHVFLGTHPFNNKKIATMGDRHAHTPSIRSKEQWSSGSLEPAGRQPSEARFLLVCLVAGAYRGFSAGETYADPTKVSLVFRPPSQAVCSVLPDELRVNGHAGKIQRETA